MQFELNNDINKLITFTNSEIEDLGKALICEAFYANLEKELSKFPLVAEIDFSSEKYNFGPDVRFITDKFELLFNNFMNHLLKDDNNYLITSPLMISIMQSLKASRFAPEVTEKNNFLTPLMRMGNINHCNKNYNIYSHIPRDTDDILIYYGNTSVKNSGKYIRIKNITF